ncbi:glycopeptide antibiotics resistance protein [Paenibacillus rhizosphaerae]|uniref:Glycopeptide antibiotics resistance protein n=1 Tax=Paenibacillus rhizosphaerae TaxID=297318 RepID=A0A839TJP6_9BACL|nr:VanZ family protein [Paenibacillus rhizosphaerae]MBB3126891.1 glycopeptide antibiotics resistance protein [Paenibacillus rhizosphaerae]
MATNRKVIMIIIILYTLLILYFMLFAFGRIEASQRITEYEFIFAPSYFYHVPDLPDLFRFSLMALFGFGNFAAFIPFGFLIPMLFPMRYMRFITLFFLSILVVETVQMLTFLGSGDINDAIQNSIGASVGYAAYSLGSHAKTMRNQLVISGLSTLFLFAAVWGFCEVIEVAFTKREGTFIAINELKNGSGNAVQSTTPYPFELSSEQVVPHYNVFSFKERTAAAYTSNLSGRDIILYFKYGGAGHDVKQGGTLLIRVDGQQLLHTEAPTYQDREVETYEIPIEKANNLTIIIEGNARLWDLGYREMKYFWN